VAAKRKTPKKVMKSIKKTQRKLAHDEPKVKHTTVRKGKTPIEKKE
jgi:hypothetical protein